MKEYRLVVVDDHKMFRSGLSFLLNDIPEVKVVAEASNGLEFLDILNKESVDIVLMDINMPVMDGVEATKEALIIKPDLNIIVLSMHGEEEYYDKMEFSDWTHKLSKAPMLKAQHPGYEIYLTGTHASRGVSCADCHMPFMSEGGQKFTDHHVQSPLNNVSNSCQVCHREETEQLIKDVYSRQDKIIENRDKLEELLVRSHVEAKKAWDLGAKDSHMKEILWDIRHAQWRWDYAAASHGGSFHSPVETSRIISTGITKAQEARIKLARLLASLGYNKEVAYPDIASKAKAQKYIGLDVAQLKKEKQKFMDKVVPQWLEAAKERESKYKWRK